MMLARRGGRTLINVRSSGPNEPASPFTGRAKAGPVPPPQASGRAERDPVCKILPNPIALEILNTRIAPPPSARKGRSNDFVAPSPAPPQFELTLGALLRASGIIDNTGKLLRMAAQ